MLDLTFGEQVKIILKRKADGKEDVPSEYDAETESR